MNRERNRRWTWAEKETDDSYPYAIRAGEEVIGQVRSKSEADLICWSRAEAIREASSRAAAARRHRMVQQRLETDIRQLVEMLREVGEVLRLKRPREVLRTREELRKLLTHMKSKGHIR